MCLTRKAAAAAAAILLVITGCATSYQATPLPFRAPSSYANAAKVDGGTIAARSFSDPKEAEEAFGFDVRGAGFLPVQVVLENDGPHVFRINPQQTFLEDQAGNLWPVLSDQIAYERATKYAKTQQVFKEGAYSGFLGAAAGAIIGTAIGIVTGEGVGAALGKGAAVGAAAGATLGGLQGYGSDTARREIIKDLNQKSLQNKTMGPGLSFGVIFFPGEAKTATHLRLQLTETDTGRTYNLKFQL